MQGHRRKKKSHLNFLTHVADIFFSLITFISNLALHAGQKMMNGISYFYLRDKKAFFISLLVLIFIVVGGVFSFLLTDAGDRAQTVAKSSDVYVRIKEGMSAREIGELLEKRGVLSSATKFWLYAKLHGVDKNFHMGMYALAKEMTIAEVIDILTQGKVSVIRFTIPEGYTVEEIADLFQQKEIFLKDDVLRVAKDFKPYPYIEEVSGTLFLSEGFLFPDTYEIDTNATPRDLLSMLSKNFDARLTSEMRDKAYAQGLSIYELVTLASMVEKEARFDEDRPIIAQVFLKRLAIDMPLQSDATIQYILEEKKEDMSISDTKIESPYNSYLYRGLPPGPIANPGLLSIEAVLYPADTNYLYFVADREGHNHYARTYEEHLANVRRVR